MSLAPARVLHVDGDRTPAAVHEVALGIDDRVADAVDAHDVGAEIGEQHRRERHRPEPRQLDHAQPSQRSPRAGHCVNHLTDYTTC